jgi:glucokinase
LLSTTSAVTCPSIATHFKVKQFSFPDQIPPGQHLEHKDSNMQILTGDIGGTHTRLSICELAGGQLSILNHQTFSSQDYPSLQAVIKDYAPANAVDAAAFGVAGPVKQGVSRITNLPWEISRQTLTRQTGIPRVFLLNDLEALAWGIGSLEPTELECLQEGASDSMGNQAVIAAGTGLGQAGLFYNGAQHIAFATEGGHTDFSPTTEPEYKLFRALQEKYGHVSWERLVSGQGLVNLFDFILGQNQLEPPDWRVDLEVDPAAVISRSALEGSDPHCVEALGWFAELYGREAGNLALKMNASGGLFLGGGIAPKILPALQDSRFIHAFLGKGRMRPLLETIRVQVICSRDVSLKGLVRYATSNGGN